MNYYNYRYSILELGRWSKRDSIEEVGGLNLYTYLLNSSINNNDYLGYEVMMSITYCMAKCHMSNSGEQLIGIFHRPSIRFAIYEYCNNNASLPQIQDIVQNILPKAQPISMQNLRCIKDCLLSFPKYKGEDLPFLDKIIDFRKESIISTEKSYIYCDKNNKSVKYGFVVLNAIVITVPGNKHVFRQKITRLQIQQAG